MGAAAPPAFGGGEVPTAAPLGSYVLDFYCQAARFCVEVDGSTHGDEDQAFLDERRDESLIRQGIRTLRIDAADVLHDPDQVAAWVVEEALGRETPLTVAMRERLAR